MDLSTLKHHRGVVKGQLTKASNYAKSVDKTTTTVQTLRNKRAIICDLYQKFGNFQEEIEGKITDATELATQVNERDEFEAKYIDIISTLDQLIDEKVAAATPAPTPPPACGHSSTPVPSSSHHIRLPDIQLPHFNGSYEDWTSFEDLFKATIDSNKSLSAAQKLQYLKSCVKDEPFSLIKSFTVTDSNYAEAWSLLVSRYDNKREIIYSLVKKILYQPHLKTESVTALQSLLNTTIEATRSLKVIGRPVEHWDDILIVSTVEKMDPDTKSEWAKSMALTTQPKFEEIIKFLEGHIRALLAKGAVTTTVNSNNSTKPASTKHQSGSRLQARSHHTSSQQCSLCRGSHQLYQCSKLHSMDTNLRFGAVKKTSACINCLREGHISKDCPSKNTCRTCSKRHHSLLHFTQRENDSSLDNINTNQQSQPSDNAPSSSQRIVRTYTSSSLPETKSTQVLLKTALVHVTDQTGKKKICRALLDDGSEASFITDSCAKALGLRRSKTDVLITGISAASAGHARWMTTVRVESRVQDANIDVEVLILPKVTGTLPRVLCDSRKWSHLQNIQLADPNYFKPGDIDILLGADVVASIMQNGRKQGPPYSPVAMNSMLGWVLSGRVLVQDKHVIHSHHASCQLEQLVQRFWEIEQVPDRTPMTREEAECETHFTSTTTRKANGRYVIHLPFKCNEDGSRLIDTIGDTRALAERRLLQLEKRFQKHPQHRESYIQFMREYLQLGHMELAATPAQHAVYIPHHFVLKEDSTTTKLRVVFDASMKSTNGTSLNDTLMMGPNVQSSLFKILVRCRTFPVILKADIEKMFRQFEVAPEERDYQRILWREHPDQPISEYRLCTATYGTKPAGYLSTRCLKQLAIDEKDSYPDAAEAIISDTYVDDVITGESSTTTAIKRMQEIIEMIGQGAMRIRKWISNDLEVMKQIPPELRETVEEHTFDEDASIKSLGVVWKPTADIFTFYSKPAETVLTKRELLSEIAKVFDPVGWLSPLTINAKILFQDLWQTSKDWDQVMDLEFRSRWTHYYVQLQQLSMLQIPRCIVRPNVSEYQIHGFSDASEKALAAAAYLRCTLPDGTIFTNLIASRTKVAPVRQVSIPRLELCGAKLLCELVDDVQQAMKLNCSIQCYTDSMVALKWISSSSRKWKTFVANRVSIIQETTTADQWHHVRTHENPADLPSRGVTAEELINSSLWWNGPEWLSTNNFPTSSDAVDDYDVISEERANVVLSHHSSAPFITTWTAAFSTLRNLVSTTAVLLKYIRYLRAKRAPPSERFITPSGRKEATLRLCKLQQEAEFAEELKNLQQRKQLHSSNKLKSLHVFLDNQGIIRVGGRLNHAPVHEDTKHPIVLTKHSHLATLIIQQTHHDQLHSAMQLTHSSIQRQYWIIGAKSYIKFLIRKCIVCRRVKGETMQQLMGQLPAGRVTSNRPFLHAGVDFAGPYNIKLRRGRGSKGDKCYFAIFVCFATKAVHLEAVTSLSTEAFIACYRRFTARRGICSHLYSDCGTNFVGADKELQKYIKESETEMQHQVSHLGTTWHFNPPASPHQGGLWEAGVKSTKHHLKRVMGNSLFTMEQFQTLLCNVEACLNSRPLISISCDPLDFAPLTPGHFLIGEPLNAIPEPSLMDETENRLSYWQQVQRRTQHFWARWSNEYLTSLQQRFKWIRKQDNVCVGDLVAIHDENLPPTKWKLGRVIATHPSEDGLVRRATIRTVIDSRSTPVKYGELRRTVQKLSPILNSHEME